MSSQQVSIQSTRRADIQAEDELAPTRTEGYKVSPLQEDDVDPHS